MEFSRFFVSSAARAGCFEKQCDFFVRKLFDRPQRNSFQGESPDLVAFEAFNVMAQRSEELADFTFFPMVHLHVDGAKRRTTKSNHSAAHLLHAALKNVLGPHVAQKGQLVDAERMRFDFSHGAPVSPEEIERMRIA